MWNLFSGPPNLVEPRHPAVTAGAREKIEKPGDGHMACKEFSWLANGSARRFRNPIRIDFAFCYEECTEEELGILIIGC